MAGALGQTINMSFNAPSPHLTFKEWMARGVVGGVGHVFAFPFVFSGKIITAAGTAAVELLKMAVLIILIPTLLWMGFMLFQKVSQSQSIEEGAAMIVTDAKKVGTGVSNGISSEAKPTPKPQP
jgi:glycerol-3-phosphate acyltransferase PlsY